MLFSLTGFETQTCNIICESFCNIIFRCNPVYVMCICLIPRSWLWCWFTEVFRDTRRTTGFIWVKVCACQRVSGDSRTWSCINWVVLLQPWSPPHLFSKRQAQSILSLLVFYKILLESFMIDALGYKSCLETFDAWNYLVQIYTPWTLCRSRIEYMLSHA